MEIYSLLVSTWPQVMNTSKRDIQNKNATNETVYEYIFFLFPT
jgi:hypothetical protein